MNRQEKVLYHQIYPVKLATDILADIISLYFFWQHQIIIALIILLVPSIIASGVIINFGNLESLKNSVFGRYVKKYMSNFAVIARVTGLIIAIFGAINHSWFWLIGGHILISGAWTYGLFYKMASERI